MEGTAEAPALAVIPEVRPSPNLTTCKTVSWPEELHWDPNSSSGMHTSLATVVQEADGPATGVDHGRRSRRLVAARSEQERPVADDAEESRASRCSRRKRPDSSRPGLRNRQRPSYREVDESDED